MSGGDAGFRILGLAATGASWHADLEVAPDSPWFAGHFPGEPILPAVGQLDLLARVHREAGGSGEMAGVDTLRLTRPVEPGDRLELALALPGDGGASRFTLRRRGEAAEAAPALSDGAVRWLVGSDGAENGTGPEEVPREGSEPVDTAEDVGLGERTLSEAGAGGGSRRELPDLDPAALLPHGPPARLAEEVLELGEEQVVCRGRVPAESAAVAAGQAGAWMGLELAAQAAGLLQAAEALLPPTGDAGGAARAAEPRIGYIVRLRDARFPRPTVPAGAPLVARVELEGRGGPLSLYRVTVDLEGATPRRIASANLGTYVPPAE